MKYLCLAYGDEKDWNVLSKHEQDALLAQDQVQRDRGDIVASLQPAITVQAHSGHVTITQGAFATAKVPLAGFSLIRPLAHAYKTVPEN